MPIFASGWKSLSVGITGHATGIRHIAYSSFIGILVRGLDVSALISVWPFRMTSDIRKSFEAIAVQPIVHR